LHPQLSIGFLKKEKIIVKNSDGTSILEKAIIQYLYNSKPINLL